MCDCHRVTVKDVLSVSWAAQYNTRPLIDLTPRGLFCPFLFCAEGDIAVQVLLLDEVTVDMDVVARLDLLDFFRCSPLLPAALCMLSHAVLCFAAPSFMLCCLLS